MNVLFVCYSHRSFAMSGMHFYLTLPSNASMDVFPNNKTGSYHVLLLQTIDLHGNWQVGLYSISYANMWYMLRKYENHLYYSMNGYISLKSASVDYGGYCGMVEDFIGAVNKTLLELIGNNNIHCESEYINETRIGFFFRQIVKIAGVWRRRYKAP